MAMSLAEGKAFKLESSSWSSISWKISGMQGPVKWKFGSSQPWIPYCVMQAILQIWTSSYPSLHETLSKAGMQTVLQFSDSSDSRPK